MAAGVQLVAVALLLLAGAGPRLAPAELTDGNSEHLKREHSLMKPYQGERGARRAGAGAWPGPRVDPRSLYPSQAQAPPRCRCGTSRAAPWLPASTCA